MIEKRERYAEAEAEAVSIQRTVHFVLPIPSFRKYRFYCASIFYCELVRDMFDFGTHIFSYRSLHKYTDFTCRFSHWVAFSFVV